jgi:hypothetical protein
VHIGFPKTATKFLQTAVFPQFKGPVFYYVPFEASASLCASLIDDDDTIYDPVATTSRLREHAPESSTVLVSYEGLTGHHYRTGFMNRSQIARRLKQVGFDRVLITIRNQFDAIESSYKQYIASGGVLSFRGYIGFDPEKPLYLHPKYFDYSLIHGLYAAIFGPSNVLVLQYERLHEPEFLQGLAGFLGASSIDVEWSPPVNRSLTYRDAAILRVINHFTYNSFRPSSLISKRVSTSAADRLLRRLPVRKSDRSFHDTATRAWVGQFYAESNRRLAETARIALAPQYPGCEPTDSRQ